MGNGTGTGSGGNKKRRSAEEAGNPATPKQSRGARAKSAPGTPSSAGGAATTSSGSSAGNFTVAVVTESRKAKEHATTEQVAFASTQMIRAIQGPATFKTVTLTSLKTLPARLTDGMRAHVCPRIPNPPQSASWTKLVPAMQCFLLGILLEVWKTL